MPLSAFLSASFDDASIFGLIDAVVVRPRDKDELVRGRTRLGVDLHVKDGVSAAAAGSLEQNSSKLAPFSPLHSIVMNFLSSVILKTQAESSLIFICRTCENLGHALHTGRLRTRAGTRGGVVRGSSAGERVSAKCSGDSPRCCCLASNVNKCTCQRDLRGAAAGTYLLDLAQHTKHTRSHSSVNSTRGLTAVLVAPPPHKHHYKFTLLHRSGRWQHHSKRRPPSS